MANNNPLLYAVAYIIKHDNQLLDAVVYIITNDNPLLDAVAYPLLDALAYTTYEFDMCDHCMFDYR